MPPTAPPQAWRRLRTRLHTPLRGPALYSPNYVEKVNSAAWRNWRRELLAAEREAIVSLRDEGVISPEVMSQIERDLEESRIGG